MFAPSNLTSLLLLESSNQTDVAEAACQTAPVTSTHAVRAAKSTRLVPSF